MIKKEIAKLEVTCERVTSEEVGELVSLLKSNGYTIEPVDFGIFKISIKEKKKRMVKEVGSGKLQVEELLFAPVLPVNSLSILKRLEDILRENNTNSLFALNGEAKDRAKACIMLLIIHSYGDLYMLNCVDEYSRLKKALRKD